MIFEFYGFFWILIWFLSILFPYLKSQKGGYFPQEPRADVAWQGTRTDATWHARPCGSATQTHASACVAQRWRGRVAGPREPTQMPGWRLYGRRWAGRWWAHGYSGPRLDSWGGNANALEHLSFYTRLFWSFLPCGTNLFLKFTGHVEKCWHIGWITLSRER